MGDPYGITLDGTTELALLPCGASLRRLDGYPAVALLGLGPLGSNGEPLRAGDAGLFCRERCKMFDRCPLVKAFVEIRAADVERKLLRDILLRDLKRLHRHGDLADVRDSQGSAPAGFVRFRFIFKRDDGDLHVVIPPMAEIVDHGDDGGNSGGDGGEAGGRGKDCLVGVHADKYIK